MDSLPLDSTPGKEQPLLEANGRTPVHVFDRESVLAVNTALACGRPLLVRGEPGTGKSQLALAVAMFSKCVPMSRVVDARTEAHDLMWDYDAVRRLADAQAYGAMVSKPGASVEPPELARYVSPGPLWWAFNWRSAWEQATLAEASIVEPPEGTSADAGVVLLIDEIDKADMAVPNALLECLGSGRFHVRGHGYVEKEGPEPLVILTTNTDRMLPDAFVRRCVVLHMRVPEGREELVRWLVKRGKSHFPTMKAELLERAAAKVADDRIAVSTGRIYCPPGLAEYIDLLEALSRNPQLQLDEIARFVLSKHKDPGPPHHGR